MSISTIRACACGLRTVWPQSIPAAQRSLAYANSPVVFGIPSARGTTLADPADLERARWSRCSCARPPPMRTASKIFAYPVQRQTLPESASRISSSLGSGVCLSRSAVATTRPGVQKPHWTAPASTNASWTRWSASPAAEALDRDDLVAVGLRGQHEARADERAVEEHRARAAFALLARVLRAGQAEPLAERVEQALARPDVGLAAARR